jgi:DNA-directed RNA polymerase specialized sigma24 family protein
MASSSAGDTLVDSAPSPEEAVMTAETRAAVRAATGELTGRRRVLVDVLFYQPPQSYEEVARRTGMPVGSIGPTRRRTLQELHQLLRARGPFSAPAKVA